MARFRFFKMRKIYILLPSFLMASLSLVSLIRSWNSPERWRFYFSLIGFSIFFLMFIAVIYVVFFRKKTHPNSN
jgi:hypothetical protein